MRRFYSSLRLAALVAALQPPALSYALRGKRFVAKNAVGGTNSDTSTYSTSWDSSPFHLEAVTDNGLGLAAKTCAENYCHVGINGLDLWLSLEESCLNQQHIHPFLEEKIDRTGGGYRYKSSGSWSLGVSVVVCGFVMVVCTWIGFKLGSAAKPCLRA